LYINRPVYRFLKEHEPVRSDSVFRKLHRTESTIYSFEADYDSICEAANSELLPKGYFCRKETAPHNRSHTFRNHSTEDVIIVIEEDVVFDAEKTRDLPRGVFFSRKDDWLSVQAMSSHNNVILKTVWKCWGKLTA